VSAEGIENFSLEAQQPAAGRLLVASPTLHDPNFRRTVVLLLDHDEEGTLGVVLNRPTTVPVASVLPGWADTVDDPPVLFDGGPVSADSALAVACVPEAEGEDPVGFRRLFGPTGMVDLDTPLEVLAPAMTRMRIFAGYAGWGGGQLEAELDEGSWYVVAAETADIFAASPEDLWRQVLRRQHGPLAWVATMPTDPTRN
jgi:putative transcriptional regulator